MSDLLKASLIIASAIVASVLLWIYFSPYQTCIRMVGDGVPGDRAASHCARALGGKL